MKKSSVFIFLSLVLLLSVFVVADNKTNTSNTDSGNTDGGTVLTGSSNSDINLSKIEEGFVCLENELGSDCSGANTVEELAFTLLASPDNIGQACSDRLNSFKKSDCFGTGSSCDVRDTALAVLALDHIGQDTSAYENWLLNQTKTATDIIWYLQQDSDEATSCEVNYDSTDYAFDVGSNKKIDSSAGSCLSLARSSYWFQVSPTCYDKSYTVVCDKEFKANLLYQQPNSEVIYVLSDTKSASASGTVNLKIKSKCFSTGNSCDYEGSSWAVLALEKVGRDVDEFVPYLVASEDSNERFLPSAFLHLIVDYSEYGTKLIQQQVLNSWLADGSAYNEYYDTSLALLALSSSSSEAVTRARNWLLNQAQDGDGCWNNKDITSTSFSLFALEQRSSRYNIGGGTSLASCTASDFYCVSSSVCPSGDVLNNYVCTGLSGSVCCKTENLESCDAQFGQICSSGKTCDGLEVRASDTNSCCLSSCSDPTPSLSACEIGGGSCRASCTETQTESSASCDLGTESLGLTCCVQDTTPEKKSLWWLWLLLVILIILIVLAIIFRDKIKVWVYKKKSKFKKDDGKSSRKVNNSGGPRPGSPPYGARPPMRRPGMPLVSPGPGFRRGPQMPSRNGSFPPRR